MRTHLIGPLLGLVFALVSHAQPVSGEYAYTFSGTNVPLFYFNGTFSTNLVGEDERLVLELTPQGRFRGTYFGHYEAGVVSIDLGGKPTGRFSGTSPQYHLSLSVRGTLRGTAYGRPVAGTYTLNASADSNASTGLTTGTRRVVVCLPGRGCRTTSDSFSNDTSKPESGEGDWSLTLNVTNRNNRISGIARATLAESGRTVDFRVRGTYSARLAVTKLQLRGIGDAAGVVLKLEADPAMALHALRGTLFGQRIEASSDDL